MTQVDFYMTTGDNEQARQLFACRLIEKATAHGKRVYVHTDTRAQTEALDHLLWTFKPNSFIAHECGAEASSLAPVVISCDSKPDAQQAEVLINLGNQVPGFFSRFERVLEILNHNADIRQQGRERYSFYRDRGYPLNYHDLDKS